MDTEFDQVRDALIKVKSKMFLTHILTASLCRQLFDMSMGEDVLPEQVLKSVTHNNLCVHVDDTEKYLRDFLRMLHKTSKELELTSFNTVDKNGVVHDLDMFMSGYDVSDSLLIMCKHYLYDLLLKSYMRSMDPTQSVTYEDVPDRSLQQANIEFDDYPLYIIKMLSIFLKNNNITTTPNQGWIHQDTLLPLANTADVIEARKLSSSYVEGVPSRYKQIFKERGLDPVVSMMAYIQQMTSSTYPLQKPYVSTQQELKANLLYTVMDHAIQKNAPLKISPPVFSREHVNECYTIRPDSCKPYCSNGDQCEYKRTHGKILHIMTTMEEEADIKIKKWPVFKSDRICIECHATTQYEIECGFGLGTIGPDTLKGRILAVPEFCVQRDPETHFMEHETYIAESMGFCVLLYPRSHHKMKTPPTITTTSNPVSQAQQLTKDGHFRYERYDPAKSDFFFGRGAAGIATQSN